MELQSRSTDHVLVIPSLSTIAADGSSFNIVTNNSPKRIKLKEKLDSILQSIFQHKTILFSIALLCGYVSYFLVAMLRCWKNSQCQLKSNFWTLVAISLFGLGIGFCKAIFGFINQIFETKIVILKDRIYQYQQQFLQSRFANPLIIYLAVPAICILFIFIDALALRRDYYSLVSLVGIAVIISACYLGSYHRSEAKARPTVAGIGLQFLFAIFVLRLPMGEALFSWLGDAVAKFLSNGDAGASFVWRATFATGDFAFAILPIIPFFAAITSVLYYLGWIQVVIKVLATVMEKLTGTTAGESTTCSANVFLGMTEAPLLIKPLLKHMTKSELHAVMTGGFSTIAGASMGAFIALKVEPRHLLAASLMAAPGSLALSKLVYPETEQTKLRAKDVKKFTEQKRRSSLATADDNDTGPQNILEAACEGASNTIPMVAGIVANIIAIIAILSFLNSLISWFGEQVGLAPPDIDEPLTLELIASYLFWPMALLIGVPARDCRHVGKLLGIKLITNEFVAYMKMGEMIQARDQFEHYHCKYLHHHQQPQLMAFDPVNFSLAQGSNKSTMLAYERSLVEEIDTKLLEPLLLANGSYFLPAVNETTPPFLGRRAQSLATYALCGFANLASVGIQMGSIASLCPSKKSSIATFAFRAMLTGTAVNFLNAALAGTLLSFVEPSWDEICSNIAQ